MKRHLLALLAALAVTFLAASASAQFGARLGANFSNIDGNTQDLKIRTGLLIGGAYDLAIPGLPIDVGAELLYSMQGGKFDSQVEGFRTTLDLQYVQLPLLLRVNLPLPIPPALDVYVGGGAYLSYLVNASVTTTNTETGEQEKLESDDPFEPLIYGFVALLGTNVSIPGLPVGIRGEMRYWRDLVDAVESEATEERNSVFAFVLGVDF